LLALHRHHPGTHMRDAKRDIALDGGALRQPSSVMLAAQLLGCFASPSEILAVIDVFSDNSLVVLTRRGKRRIILASGRHCLEACTLVRTALVLASISPRKNPE
jgi:hypothetical protein